MSLRSLSIGQMFSGGVLPRRGDGMWAVFGILIAAVVALPILVIASYVFVPSGKVWSHLADTVLTSYIVNTLFLLLGVGVGTLLIGVGAGWLVTMCRFPGRRFFEWALLLPFAVPAYVLAYTYTGLLDFSGPVQEGLRTYFGWGRGDYWFPEVRSLGGAVTMMVLVLYPYVYLLARAAFLEQSVCVLEVSRTLGRGPWRSFTTVALPLARPGIVAGLSLALIETLNDFGTVDYFAVDTFTTGIYRTWLGMGEAAAAAQLAAFLMLFVFTLIIIERSSRGGAKFHHTSGRYRDLPGHRLTGWRAVLAFLTCFLPLFFGFLLPGAALLTWSIELASETLDSRYLQYALNTLVLAAITSAVAVSVALVMALGLRLHGGRLLRAASRIAAMGYAVPGSVIAVGVLLVAAGADNAVDGWMRRNFGLSTGLILTGTVAGMVFAYLVRFLAVSFNTIEAGLGKVTPNMDRAARTLGETPAGMLRRVHVPLMRGSMLTAALLVFVDVTKELPATIIMRPFNFDTLAIRTYQLASDELLREAASSALGIVLVGILPAALLSIAITRSRPGHEHDGT